MLRECALYLIASINRLVPGVSRISVGGKT
jgi:hypothetical protein